MQVEKRTAHFKVITCSGMSVLMLNCSSPVGREEVGEDGWGGGGGGD